MMIRNILLVVLCILLQCTEFYVDKVSAAETLSNIQAKETGIQAAEVKPTVIKALILPKFEVGKLLGDFPGEAQHYYEAYFRDAQAFDIKAGTPGSKLFVNRDGLALYITGMGKLNAALSVNNILQDKRFDFSKAYIISTGCAGAAVELCTMGDVVIGSATVDGDLGHHVDARELKNKKQKVSWYKLEDVSEEACAILNKELVNNIYTLVKDIKLNTTPVTRRFMAKAFKGQAWAVRNPKVMKGTIVTGDNYWKGIYGHYKATAQCKAYNCPDPYAITEMEDHAIARALVRNNLLNRYIVLRVSVNTEVFMNNDTPEKLWDKSFEAIIQKDEDNETADIFETAMKNNFAVGKVILDNILRGDL